MERNIYNVENINTPKYCLQSLQKATVTIQQGNTVAILGILPVWLYKATIIIVLYIYALLILIHLDLSL